MAPPRLAARLAVPPDVRQRAEARAAARAARDWATADRLRVEIEAAGWKVIDTAARFRLEPAHPPDLEAGGEIRYGRSDAVPSRLAEAVTGLASVIVLAREDRDGARRAVAGMLEHAPPDVDVIVVADGLADRVAGELTGQFGSEPRVETVRTSAILGQGAALNVGLRRSRASVVILLDTSVEPTGDVVTPLVRELDDPGVGVAGPFGLRSPDLRHFEEVTTSPAAAIEGYLMAFRRADAADRGPVDEGFRFYRNLDVWWSLVLRDEGAGRPPRAAAVVPDLPLARHEHLAWASTAVAERERLSKRNFYRILARFRDRLDLAVG